MYTEKAIIETYTLTLTKEERDWLRNIVQNPLWVENPMDEDPLDAKMRAAFWNALE